MEKEPLLGSRLLPFWPFRRRAKLQWSVYSKMPIFARSTLKDSPFSQQTLLLLAELEATSTDALILTISSQ